jgi:hypothetical protein
MKEEKLNMKPGLPEIMPEESILPLWKKVLN